MRVAIYARVSTKDKGQDTDNQLIKLREYCVRQQWPIIAEYVDHVSGKSGDRDAFKRLFADALRRSFDVVAVWALDRFTREGVLETFQYVRQINASGVQFESYIEAHFRTTGPAGELMLTIAAWIAKQERSRISERTKAGVERAKRQGKHCGRPKSIFRRDEALRLYKGGMTLREIAEQLGVSFMTTKKGCNKTGPFRYKYGNLRLSTSPQKTRPARFWPPARATGVGQNSEARRARLAFSERSALAEIPRMAVERPMSNGNEGSRPGTRQ